MCATFLASIDYIEDQRLVILLIINIINTMEHEQYPIISAL